MACSGSRIFDACKYHKLIYRIEISENDNIHHLTFNEMGKVLKHEIDPSFAEDYYEGSFYGENPESIALN